eukprot:scaffold1220_cov259-Pinguiococcus_pyrenoidosus.AAC.153
MAEHRDDAHLQQTWSAVWSLGRLVITLRHLDDKLGIWMIGSRCQPQGMVLEIDDLVCIGQWQMEKSKLFSGRPLPPSTNASPCRPQCGAIRQAPGRMTGIIGHDSETQPSSQAHQRSKRGRA